MIKRIVRTIFAFGLFSIGVFMMTMVSSIQLNRLDVVWFGFMAVLVSLFYMYEL